MRGAPRAPMAPDTHLSNAYTDVRIRSGTTCTKIRQVGHVPQISLKEHMFAWLPQEDADYRMGS